MKRIVRVMAVAATAGMFAVLVMGSTVTNTGSEHGCGKSWPLCHGKLIPQFALSTAIEFSHRAIVGVETMLILAFAAVALYLYWRRREMKILAAIMVGFLFLQAGLGAWAVMYPQVSAILALHFGVSLIAFASVLLATTYIFEVGGSEHLRDHRLPLAFQRFVWGLAGFSYIVVYLGAYVRHSNATKGCKGWPLCNGAAIPNLEGTTATAFAHRLAAGLLIVGLLVLVMWASKFERQRPDVYFASVAALVMAILQALAGAAVVWTNLDLFTALAHAALVGLMFAALAYVGVHVLPRSYASERAQARSLRSAAEATAPSP